MYFKWLQKNVPTGKPDILPEISDTYETSVSGIYCIGDLTGIPLIKLAAESGYEIIHNLADNIPKKENQYDFVIVGAGPSGISAAIEAKKMGYSAIILESSKTFNTIKNFPVGKPILVTPESPKQNSDLKFSNGNRETLLEELNKGLNDHNIDVNEGENLKSINGKIDSFVIKTNKNTYNCSRIIIAIGKTGNPRMLNVKGGKSDKVFTRLIDPLEIKNSKVLIVGGGDSAVETALALCDNNNEVSFSYRKASLTRPKLHNINKFEEYVKSNKIRPYFESEVYEVSQKTVTLKTNNEKISIPNDKVFALLGTEVPVSFFKKFGIKLNGEKYLSWYLNLIALLSFFSMLYFGKSGLSKNLLNGNGFGDNLIKYFTSPLTIFSSLNTNWYSSLNFILGWGSSIIFLLSGFLSLIFLFTNYKNYFSSTWKSFKTIYFFSVAIFITSIYFRNHLMKDSSWVESSTYWYSFLYCLTMIIFGIRRIYKAKTKYVTIQTLSLILIQVFFLFLLPFYIYDSFISPISQNSFVKELFPQGKWSSFGFILFWPLNINNFGTSTFWFWFPFFQTFVFLPFLIYKFGKGAYCGWICSCGGMAETLGDDYRTLAPHGATAKKMENIGQIILWFAFIATFFKFTHIANPEFKHNIWYIYKFTIDIIFAGILGLGVYFFYSGRIWCRYGCPLAALMHIYSRFSVYRIRTDKKRCISCNICTKVCHMGIDVMNYANKGIPLNDVECVKCSSCIISCPVQALTFSKTDKIDTDNLDYLNNNLKLYKTWQSGLNNEKIILLEKSNN